MFRATGVKRDETRTMPLRISIIFAPNNEWSEFQYIFFAQPILEIPCDERLVMRVSLKMMDASFSLDTLDTFHVSIMRTC